MGTSRGPRDSSAQGRVGEGSGPCHPVGDTMGRYWTQKCWGQSRCSSIWSIFSLGYLQDLVTFPNPLAVSQAPLLHAGHEDSHIVATRQPQPHALGLHKLHDPGVGAVPATGKDSQPSGDMQGKDREALTLSPQPCDTAAPHVPQPFPLPLADIPIIVGSSGSEAGVGAVPLLLHGFQKVCRKESWSRSSSGCAEAQGALAWLHGALGSGDAQERGEPPVPTHLGPEHQLQSPWPQAPCSIVSSPWNKVSRI